MSGRKPIEFNEDKIKEWLQLGFSYHYIANRFNCSRHTLRRWMERTNFVLPKVTISNDDLDEIIQREIENQPRRGEKMLAAFLSNQGYKVPRLQLRECIRRVDMDGLQQRRCRRIQRRVYNVEGPHHLWHIDGNHKLIRYGMVIHGCIDGRTRTIIYLSITDNNTSKTVLDLFKVRN